MELLVVIGIVVILIGLLLPAIQSAREAARRTQCRSNLHQIGVAVQSFSTTNARYPHGGWGRAWTGIPERGVGRDQPGGWIFQVLPHIEETDLQRLGSGANGPAREEAYSQRLATPIPILHCPSRRAVGLYRAGDRAPHHTRPLPAGLVSMVARTDYAINSGATHAFSFLGPTSLAEGDDPSYWRRVTDNKGFTGISHLRRSAPPQRITDGMSRTILVGEKFLAPQHYDSGESAGDNETAMSGYDIDLHRFVAGGSLTTVIYPPHVDENDLVSTFDSGFGSAHSAALEMLFCDGSVRAMAYEIDPKVWLSLGHRADGG